MKRNRILVITFMVAAAVIFSTFALTTDFSQYANLLGGNVTMMNNFTTQTCDQSNFKLIQCNMEKNVIDNNLKRCYSEFNQSHILTCSSYLGFKNCIDAELKRMGKV